MARTLLDEARRVRQNAYAPYSGFKVGAAIRAASGRVYTGCKVENAAYPQGICAEAAALAVMVSAGETERIEVAVIAEGLQPVAPCGGCRQKIAEFASPEINVTMANLDGVIVIRTLGDLLPEAFTAQSLRREKRCASTANESSASVFTLV